MSPSILAPPPLLLLLLLLRLLLLLAVAEATAERVDRTDVELARMLMRATSIR